MRNYSAVPARLRIVSGPAGNVIPSRSSAGRRFGLARLSVALLLVGSWNVAPAQDKALSREEMVQGIMRSLFSPDADSAHSTMALCFIWNDAAYAVHRDVDEQAMLSILSRMPSPRQEPAPDFRIDKRFGWWTVTATDGPDLVPRTPITLTYSFLPDGTPIQGSEPDESNDPSNIFSTLDNNFPGGRTAWKAQFAAAFGRIGELTAIQYIEVDDDGAFFPTAPGVVGLRGDIRIGMHDIDGAGQILARNFLPTNGDMVIDSSDLTQWTNDLNDFVILRNVIIHEHGHGLGYLHVAPTDGTKLMEARLSTNFDGPQQDDIRGLQRQYLDGKEPNDIPATAYDLGTLPQPIGTKPVPVVVRDVAIEDNGLLDYYSFLTIDGALIDVTVAPVGSTYDEGPRLGGEDGTVTPIDALAIHDLSFHVVAPNGITILASVNATAAGESETLNAFALRKGNGRYFLRVGVSSVADDIQRYEITITFVGVLARSRTWSRYRE